MSRQVSKEEWACVAPGVRNPAERAILCALARFANRTNGVVQEPRATLAAAAAMSVGSFRTHTAALSGRERGLIAATTLRSNAGDYDTTIYTLIGWLHLRGMSEPEHLRLDADIATTGDGSAEDRQGSANLTHGGLPKSSRPGVVEFGARSAADCQTSAKLQQAPNIDSSSILREGSLEELPPLPPFPRARGSSGGLKGDAGEIVALVNHPHLDPEKDPDLVVPANSYVARWKRAGLSVAEIALEICAVLAKRDARKGATADRIHTWEFFDKPLVACAATKKRVAEAPDLSGDHDGQRRFDNVRPLGGNAAEREHALAGDRRSSWAQAVDERRALPERG